MLFVEVFFPFPQGVMDPNADLNIKIIMSIAYAVGLLCGTVGAILERLGFDPEIYGQAPLFQAGVFFVTETISDIKDFLVPVRVVIEHLFRSLFGPASSRLVLGLLSIMT